jgi:hypothetical protein
VCSTWLIEKSDHYLLDVWRWKLQFPDLKRKLNALAREHEANVTLIERTGPGLQLLQELRMNPAFRFRGRSASIVSRTRSSAWRRRAPASKLVRSICPHRLPNFAQLAYRRFAAGRANATIHHWKLERYEVNAP